MGLDDALALAADSPSKTTIYLHPGDYTSERLYRDERPQGVDLVGTSFESVSGDLTLTGINATEYTFAGQTWSSKQWLSYDLIWLRGPSNYQPGKARTITSSGVDSITVALPHKNGDLETPQVGDVFQVVRPLARIVLPDNGATRTVNKAMVNIVTLYGGHGRGMYRYAPARDHSSLENVVLQFAPNTTAQTQRVCFTGAWRLNGCHVETIGLPVNLSLSNEIRFTDAEVHAGQDLNQDTLESMTVAQRDSAEGWGLSTRYVNAPLSASHRVMLTRTRGALVWVGGEGWAQSGSRVLFTAGSFRRHRVAGYAHGVLCSSWGTQLGFDGAGSYFCWTPYAEPDLHVEYGSHIDFTAPNWHHEGTNAFFHGRFNASALIKNEPIGSNIQLSVHRNSMLQIQGPWPTAQFRCGLAPTITRPIGAWAVNESILSQGVPGDGCSIFRIV